VDLALAHCGCPCLLASRAGRGVSSLSAMRRPPPCDAEGGALFVECLAKVADRFATVLCITPLRELKDAFPYSLPRSGKNGKGAV